MSRRKHVTLAMAQDVQPPADGQSIVRALGSRGGNIVEVEYPDGRNTLVLMPARFNKKLWVRRGGYLIVDEAEEAAADDNSRVTGTIVAVLYDEHVRQLKRTPGIWPPEFADDDAAAAANVGEASSSKGGAASSSAPGSGGGSDNDEEEGDESSDDSLEPLYQNSNRRVVYYEVSDSDEEDEESEDEEAFSDGAAASGSGGTQQVLQAAAGVGGSGGGGGGAVGGQQQPVRGRLTEEEQERVLGELGAKLSACELGKRPAA